MPPVAPITFDASLVDLIARKGGRIRPRQLQHSDRRRYPTSTSAVAALQQLRNASLGIWEWEPSRGRPARVFVLQFQDSFSSTHKSKSGLPWASVGHNSKKFQNSQRVIGPGTRSILIDRLDCAVDDGVLNLIQGDDKPIQSVDVTIQSLAIIQQVLFPEEYTTPEEMPAPSGTAPGSADRIAEYARRVAVGEVMCHPKDASADGPGRGLKVTQRANGTGFKVLGWEGEVSEEDA